MVATTPVSRRPLSLTSIDQLLEELDRIEAADRRGTLRALGNWTPGQILAHLAAWVEYGWEGYPMKRPPLPIRWLLKLVLWRILRQGMASGVKIPGVAGGTTGAEAMETAAALQRLRLALQRLTAAEPVLYESPGFGAMSQDERVRLQLRHAELHLSYLDLGEGGEGDAAAVVDKAAPIG